MSESDLQVYLNPTEFIDCDAPEIIDFVDREAGGIENSIDKAVKLYYWVRDNIRYNYYSVSLERHSFKASNILNAKEAFCIPKAILLTALARTTGIPARLGFADVRNHLATEKLLKQIKTDIFVFHGYSELYLHGKWVKATPAFNLSLCEKFKVKPLEFDGLSDSIFHPFDEEGLKHMEYLVDHGSFANLPYDMMIHAFHKAYPHFFDRVGWKWPGS